jgi:Protein of unknown function (DUF3047)
MRIAYISMALLVLMLLPATHAFAGQVFLPGHEPGWVVKEKDGKAVTYHPEETDEDCICLKSDKASFSIQREIKVDIKKTPYMTWRWRANALPDGGDFRDGDKDDQAAQLFVAFEGRDSISYIWDTTAPVGSTGEQWIPWVMTVKIVVVESGPKNLGGWVSYTRNVYEDYKKLFGKEPPMAEGLRFQINSQHTGTSAESCIERIEFSEKAPK